MTRNELIGNILKKKSFLCVGLDSDINRIPSFLHKTDDPVFEFNRGIINATADFAVAYKPNIAFYESRGASGWVTLEKTVRYIKENYRDHWSLLTLRCSKTSHICRAASLEKANSMTPEVGRSRR